MPHRHLYISSFWSAIWNELASERARAVHLAGAVKAGNSKGKNPHMAFACEGDIVRISDKRRSDGKREEKVHVVSAQEAKLKKFSIFDVALPLPGV